MTKPAGPPPLDHHLCFSIYSAGITINRFYRPLLDELGITYPQYLVLSALWESDGQSVGAIAQRLSLESSTITPLVKRLESAGLLTRLRSQSDERQVVVSLTANGKALHTKSKCLTEALLRDSGFTLDRMMHLNAEVRAFRDALLSKS